MPKRAALGVTICVISSLFSASLHAQNRTNADESIDAMRGNPAIGQNDQQRIRDWVALVVAELAATPENQRDRAGVTFRKAFQAQVTNATNSQAFRSQFVAQTAAVAATHFADANVDPTVARWLARALLDMNAIESVPGLLAGLASKVRDARYLSARAIVLQHRTIAADSARLPNVILALRKAGVAETNPVVVSRIYRALAFSGQASAVIEAYLAIFDTRLAERRKSNTCDGAELEAFLYFSSAATLNSLSQPQKTQLVGRVAVFLRLDAARYENTTLGFVETDMLERSLVETEAILKAATNASDGGNITDLFKNQGRAGMDLIPAEAAKWVGNAAAKSQGALSVAPWSVPIGAP